MLNNGGFMFNKYMVGLLVLGIIILSTVYGEMNDSNVSVENITKMSYDHILFLEYDADNNPVVYIHELKKYYIKPIKVCTIGINESLLKSMNFKVNKTNYDVLISNEWIETSKSAIFFTPISGSTEINETNSLIYWNNDPLNFIKHRKSLQNINFQIKGA
jgi:hypothetical protein